MTNDEKGRETSILRLPATVVAVLDAFKVVINRGSVDGVLPGQRFLVYALSSDPITDPGTGDNLGYLEIVKGTGKVVHLQERLATLESDRKLTSTRSIRRHGALFSLGGETETVTDAERSPFDSAARGDHAKPV